MPVTTSQRTSLTAAFARRFGSTDGTTFAAITDHRVRITRPDGTWLEGDFARTRMRVTAQHDAATTPADAVPELIVPTSRHLAPAAAQAIGRAYRHGRNFMTPHLIGYASVGGTFACEVSTGDGIRFTRGERAPDIFGVTVVSLATNRPLHNLSRMLTTRDAACRYLGKLAHLAAYRRARGALVFVIKHALAIVRAEHPSAAEAVHRIIATRKEMATLRARYAITLDRFGLDAYDHDAPEADVPSLGQRHAAARHAAV